MEQGARSLGKLGGQRAGSRDLGQLRRLAAYLRPYRGHVVGAARWRWSSPRPRCCRWASGLRYLIDGGFSAGPGPTP